MSERSDFIRKSFKEYDDVRDAGLTTPEDIVRYDDICYGEDAVWQKLDVYRPKDKVGEQLPVIVSIHGGGWVYGDKERYKYYCMSLAQQGFAVVNYTYRLAPEFLFPASLEDANLVFSWVFEHAAEYGFDVAHIFGVGDSAGAHQLSLYAAICTNPELAQQYPFQVPEKFAPTAIALNCGVYEILRDPVTGGSEHFLLEEVLPGKGTDEEIDKINVVAHITEAFPPTFYMTCTGDSLQAQAVALGQKLMEKKIPHEFHFYGDATHELGHVFHCNMKLEEAAHCNQEQCDYFRKFL